MNLVNDTLVTSGYVSLLEPQKQHSSPSRAETRKRSRNIIRIFFLSVIFLAFVGGAILIALIHKNNIDFQRQQAKETAQIFCSMTQHFSPCLSSISYPITSTIRHRRKGPDEIFVFSLQLAIEQLRNLTSLTKSLIMNSATPDSAPLQQCTSLIHDSLDRLNTSLTASARVFLFSQTRDNETLALEKIDYLLPKVNDSVTYLTTCFQLLRKVESGAGVDEVSRRVHKATVDAGMAFDFLQSREEILFQLQFVNLSSRSDVKFGCLTTVLISLPQYMILLLLFWLVWRRY